MESGGRYEGHQRIGAEHSAPCAPWPGLPSDGGPGQGDLVFHFGGHERASSSGSVRRHRRIGPGGVEPTGGQRHVGGARAASPSLHQGESGSRPPRHGRRLRRNPSPGLRCPPLVPHLARSQRNGLPCPCGSAIPSRRRRIWRSGTHCGQGVCGMACPRLHFGVGAWVRRDTAMVGSGKLEGAANPLHWNSNLNVCTKNWQLEKFDQRGNKRAIGVSMEN